MSSWLKKGLWATARQDFSIKVHNEHFLILNIKLVARRLNAQKTSQIR
jgi:hypothetical protein